MKRGRRELSVNREFIKKMGYTEALLAGENRLLKMVAGGCSLEEILSSLCRLIEELSSGCVCGIVLVDGIHGRLEHGSAPSLPDSYNEAIHDRPVNPDSGPCAAAAYLKEQIVAGDVTSETRWATNGWCGLAIAHDLRSCWSTPILSAEGIALGVFAIYWREPRIPGSQDQDLIEQTTNLAAIAIERRQSEEEMRRGRAFLAEGQRLSKVGTYGWKVSTGELFWSEETYRIYEYDTSIKPVIPMVYRRVHPEDLHLMEQVCKRASQEGKDYEHHFRAVMPDGSLKYIHIVAHSSRDKAGNLEYVGAVSDVTEQKLSQEALLASELLARGQVNALTRTVEALAMESAPDGMIGHVLRTIRDEFDAHSASVWRRDEMSGLLNFEVALEGGKLVSKSDASILAETPYLPVHLFWPSPEDFRMGKPSMLKDIREVPAFAWRDHLLAQGIAAVFCVPMLIAGRVEGVTGIRFTAKRTFRDEEMELAKALANQAMLALELTRLSAQSRQAAVMAERNRVARDIHDTLAQGFTGVILQLEAAKGAVAKGNIAETTARIKRAAGLARSSLGEARRSVRALRPRSLRDGNLFTAMKTLLKRMANGTKLNAQITVEGRHGEIPTDWQEELLRIVQESLTNTLKHARARNFKATLKVVAENSELELVDDGRGFDPQAEHEGFGLVGMKERVKQMGGQFVLQSKPRNGTRIRVLLSNGASLHSELGDERA
jgi:signal transduction histidine kinase/PAS domain-containing protein